MSATKREFFPSKGFILTMRNVNRFKKPSRDRLIFGFILTMRNVNELKNVKLTQFKFVLY